ncbi:MAG: LytTR family DNA-binding domain-containing protein [Ferruginibacter sp.]
MKVVVIEDEQMTAEDLVEILVGLDDRVQVQKVLHSVAESMLYFKSGARPDLIFCDIALGDGYSFEIFQQCPIDAPVVFCTAFNEYALEAFKNNGIDYVLKPFNRDSIAAALQKFNSLKLQFTATSANMQQFLHDSNQWPEPAKPQSKLLVTWKDKIIPVSISEIALFTIEFKTTQLVTFSNQKYSVNLTLDELEKICGNEFYRASRQYLVNKAAVKDAMQYHTRKLFVNLSVPGNYEITISKLKVPEFLGWLQS